jgi:hypothetical protein
MIVIYYKNMIINIFISYKLEHIYPCDPTKVDEVF